MEYQGFVVRAFEQEAGKWRAKVLRSSGEPLIKGRKRIVQFITGTDTATASGALLLAIQAIDAGTFSGNGAPETIQRRRGLHSNARTKDRSVRPAQRASQDSNERKRSG
jgi:hypothetical protein